MRHTTLPVLASFLAILSAACFGSEPPTTVDYHFDFETAAGTEMYWCEYTAMPWNGGRPIDVAGFRWQTSDLHHWALFRTHGLDQGAINGMVFPCFGSPETDAAALTSIVSVPTTTQTELIYPDGYALPFGPGEVLMVQAHTVNATSARIHPSLDLTVFLADKPTKKLGEFQMYDPFVFIPARGVGHASMRCAVPSDVDLVWMATHEHTRGTGFEVYLDLPGRPPSNTPLLSAGSWEEPATKLGPIHVPAGSSVRVFCNYADTTGVDTYQGPDKATNEMCQFYGAYSPPLPLPGGVLVEACVPSFVEGGTGDMYGTGATSCADTVACVSVCSPADAPAISDGKFDVGPCWQRCMVDACPSAATPFNKLFGCIHSECGAECAGGAGDPACQPCVGVKCLSEVWDCESAPCSAPKEQ